MNVSGGVSGTTALSGLSDVTISSPTNGQVPVYNSGTGKWENNTVSATYNAVSCVAYTSTSQGGVAASTYTDVNFGGEILDTNSIHSTASATHKFVMPYTGKHKLTFSIVHSVRSASTTIQWHLVKNGTRESNQGRSSYVATATQFILTEVEFVFSGSAGDEFWLQVNPNGIIDLYSSADGAQYICHANYTYLGA